MDNIDELLKRYFEACSSLEDEEILKTYFLSNDINEQHLPYKALFDAFKDEYSVKIPMKLPKHINKSSQKTMWWRGISASGIAASLILGMWLMTTDVAADYAYVNGVRFDDQEKVELIANQKIGYVSDLLGRSMKPVEEFRTVKKNLKPLKTINLVDQKLKFVKDKITDFQ